MHKITIEEVDAGRGMTNIISVIFKWECGGPVLFFPEYSANWGRICCYAHAGQHSEASVSYYKGLRNPVKGVQYEKAQALLREYENMNPDYAFRVVKRDTKKFRKERYANAC